MEGGRERALCPGASHAALRVQKVQVVTGEPIPAEDDVELRT